jgi:hypothetical protein
MRMTVRYHCRRPDDAGLRERLRALAHERRRFGNRRLHVLLRREGFLVNNKRLFRIYRDFFASRSFSAALSSMASARSFFSLAFSLSNPFSRFASGTSSPPRRQFPVIFALKRR